MEAEEVQTTAADGSRVWLPVIVDRIAHSLPANEVACTLRLVDKTTSLQLEDFITVRLSLSSPLESFKQRWGSPDAFRGLTRKQRLKLLCLTAASGSIDNLKVALANTGLLVTSELLEAAAEAGQLEACKLLRDRGCPWGVSLDAAARGGHRHVCEWLLASGCTGLPTAVYAAARGGHEDLMHWLLQMFREDSPTDVNVGRLLEEAAVGFSLAPFQQLHQQLLAGQQQQGGDEVQPPPGLSQQEQGAILAAAAGSPTADWQAKVQWLEGLGYPRTTESSAWVASLRLAMSTAGDYTVGRLQWLHSRGYPLGGQLADITAQHGNLAALRFLVEQAGVQPSSYVNWIAAVHGHLDVLQYLHASGVPMDAIKVASSAASNGHMSAVAWAVEVLGVNPANAPTLLSSAAESGNIGLMTWLLERGWTCGENTSIATNAATSGCEEALEWLVARGCRWPADGYPYMVVTIRFSDLAMVHCLHRLGCPWGPNLLVTCIQEEVPVYMLRCLVEMGCPGVGWDAAKEALKYDKPWSYSTAVLKWLGEEPRRQQRKGQHPY